MLHAVAELTEDRVRNIRRALRHEVDAHALRPDQAHDLLDLVDEGSRRIVEQQMGLIEKEHEGGLVGIADFREMLEKLRKHPQQERRVQLRLPDELVGHEDVHDASTLGSWSWDEVVDVEHRFAEELLAALLFD